MMRRQKQIGFQRLEERTLLVAGLIPIDLAIPLTQPAGGSEFSVDGNVVIKLKAMVLDPKADEQSDVSLTGYDFSGSGDFSGPIEGLTFEGTFATDPIPPNVDPVIPIQVHPATQTIDIVLTQFGTFEASSILGPVTGTFKAVVAATLQFTTHAIVGTTTLTFETNDRVETNVSPFQLPNSIPAEVEFPDASKPSISGRVFRDASGDGQRQSSELGVEGIRVSRSDSVAVTATAIESITSDAKGYYSFYNLEGKSTAIRFQELPVALDFGKRGPSDALLGSDADSLGGSTRPLAFTTTAHQLNIDAGLRSTPFEFQNPNRGTDVNDDGQTTAGDALSIINLLSRLASGANEASLSGNRLPGELFFDVDGNGRGTAADALAVIFALNSVSGLPSGEGETPRELSWLATEKTQSRSTDDDPAERSVLF